MCWHKAAFGWRPSGGNVSGIDFAVCLEAAGRHESRATYLGRTYSFLFDGRACGHQFGDLVRYTMGLVGLLTGEPKHEAGEQQ